MHVSGGSTEAFYSNVEETLCNLPGDDEWKLRQSLRGVEQYRLVQRLFGGEAAGLQDVLYGASDLGVRGGGSGGEADAHWAVR